MYLAKFEKLCGHQYNSVYGEYYIRRFDIINVINTINLSMVFNNFDTYTFNY